MLSWLVQVRMSNENKKRALNKTIQKKSLRISWITPRKRVWIAESEQISFAEGGPELVTKRGLELEISRQVVIHVVYCLIPL